MEFALEIPGFQQFSYEPPGRFVEKGRGTGRLLALEQEHRRGRRNEPFEISFFHVDFHADLLDGRDENGGTLTQASKMSTPGGSVRTFIPKEQAVNIALPDRPDVVSSPRPCQKKRGSGRASDRETGRPI
jgi:hypothetical protein